MRHRVTSLLEADNSSAESAGQSGVTRGRLFASWTAPEPRSRPAARARSLQAARLGLAAVLAVCVATPIALLAQTRPPQVKSPRLYVFDCGVLVRGEPTAYNLTSAQVGGNTNFSDACFLIVHPRGTLLWDVGIIPDAQITPGGVEIPAGRGGNANKASKTLKSQLAAIGYAPRDITYLAVSHNHADHTANANDYAGSTWLVQKAEHDLMFSDQARKQANFANYSALEHSKTVLLEGDHDVFGDGTVMLISTPGHTPGHQSLLIKMQKTGPVLLTGDLYHYAAERTLKTLPNGDKKEQTAASRAKVDDLLQKTGAQLWIQHDIVGNAKLKKSPQYYE
jgi:N-acyl homoserine lactone hydrolase